jgi:hypothetical protein
MTLCEEETEKLVGSFYNYLKQEKGLSEETASAHAHHIHFFALHYLIGYEEKNLPEVTDRDIDDYLGNRYIRKLSECEVDKKYQFVDWVKGFCRVPGSAEDELSLIIGAVVYLFSVFEERIVPALTIFGLLDFGFKKDRKEYLVNHGLGIEWFTITKLGKKIFQGIRY